MTLVLRANSSVENRTYVDSVFIRMLLCCFLFPCCLAGLEVAAAQAPLFQKQDMTDRVKLAEGFRLLKLAGNAQIPNAFCMAVDRSGDLVVSGPGYLRRLKISDEGLERVTDLPHPPSGGAQGLWCEGDDLFFVGGEGLCLIKGALGDLSDEELSRLAEPEVLSKIDVGGEHQAHAIRKGPDQWWYLICGNDTKLDPKFWSDKKSPVKDAEAGCLLRFNFELDEYQVFAHGFRNAYDFDFGPDGSVYVYDSDGERDVCLPWYRPTRVFRVAAGDHAGWVNKSWKRPSYYNDMPELVAALGRGSPTGVCYNRQNKMGEGSADRLFVGDWTFGRIVAIDLASKAPTDFLVSKGQFGFAVTDLVIGADGLLYITVGGRGTEGGLYRIEPTARTIDFPSLGLMPKSNANSESFRREQSQGPLKQNRKDDLLTNRVRELQLELGGCGGCEGMMAGYTARQPLVKLDSPTVKRVLEETTQICKEEITAQVTSNTDARGLDELFRLLAMQRIQSDKLGDHVLKILASEEDPVRGIHLLACYSFIGTSTSPKQAEQIGQFLLGLRKQIAERGLNTDRNWEPRMKELVAALARHPKITSTFTNSPALGATDTLYIAEALMNLPASQVDDPVRRKVAEGILAWCRKKTAQTTARHVKLFQYLPDAASFLRSNVGDVPRLLSPAVDVLFAVPIKADRKIFAKGLGDSRLQTQKNSAIGLRRLLDKGGESLNFDEAQAALIALSRLGSDGPATSVRKQIMSMLKSSFEKEDGFSLSDLEQTRQFLEKRFGQPFTLLVDDAVDVDQWLAKFTGEEGDAERGKLVFIKAQCAACHQVGVGYVTSSALGPSLEGITKRFSKRALFQAILEPNRDVADRYRAVLVENEDGDFVTGLKVYQSADGITLLLADGSTARINSDQIAEIKQSAQSLMPARLLDSLTPTEIADLWAFLQTL